jgi:mannonate dehydratase
MFERLCWFMERILPVAEDARVMIAGHPEDPPNPVMRHAGRWLIDPGAYDRLFERFPSPYCGIEFCQGTFTEMPAVDVYGAIERFAGQKRIAYVHLRNVRGELPKFTEVLIDEGDIDMAKALRIYQRCGYEGSFIPDHYPSLASAQGNHAIVAYSVAYIRGLMHALDIPIWGE